MKNVNETNLAVSADFSSTGGRYHQSCTEALNRSLKGELEVTWPYAPHISATRPTRFLFQASHD